MRRYVWLGLAIGALVVVTAAGIAVAARGEGPVTGRVGNLELTSGLSFSPKGGPKNKQTPIEITNEGRIKEADGSQPPAVRELTLEVDRHGEIHTKGIPVWRSGQLQATDTAAALKACRPALIGEGEVKGVVAFAKQKPLPVTSKLLLFNGGETEGRTIWYAHAYLANPVSAAIVTTVTITKVNRGRYGTLVVAKIPQVAGGAGSGTFFRLHIFKFVKVGDKRINPISGRCPDGKVKLHLAARFEDGTQMQTELIRGCTGTG